MAKKKVDSTPPPAADGVSEAAEEVVEEVQEAIEATLEEQLLTAQAEAEKNKDLYLRALADLENYRKRAQREKEDAIRFANDNLLRNTIPVLDNLERAIEHARVSNEDQAGLLKGVEMTLDQFRKLLQSSGVTPVDAIGQPFDPNFHQAMGQIPTADHSPNTVVQELQKGYLLNERLLRPSMVMVSMTPSVDPGAEQTSESQDDESSDADE